MEHLRTHTTCQVVLRLRMVCSIYGTSQDSHILKWYTYIKQILFLWAMLLLLENRAHWRKLINQTSNVTCPNSTALIFITRMCLSSPNMWFKAHYYPWTKYKIYKYFLLKFKIVEIRIVHNVQESTERRGRQITWYFTGKLCWSF